MNGLVNADEPQLKEVAKVGDTIAKKIKEAVEKEYNGGK